MLKRRMIAAFAVAASLVLVACGGTAQDGENNAQTSAATSEAQSFSSSTDASVTSSSTILDATSESNSTYLRETTWALLDNYAFAVEVDSYEGDVFEAGEYIFKEDLVLDGQVPVIWDIYVSAEYKNSISELQESELKGSVGGVEKAELTIELSAGQYVYVKYNKTAGEPGGVLRVSKQ